jgi:hypothetical protein
MNPIRYDAIASNFAEVNVEGGQVQVSWKCPATGKVVGQSTATMSADPALASRVRASVQRSVASELIAHKRRATSALVPPPVPTPPRRAGKRPSSRLSRR